MEEKVYTVADLIEALKNVDPALPVWLEGCDCTGRWNGKLGEYCKGEILLERDST